jgi:hypothetical protein
MQTYNTIRYLLTVFVTKNIIEMTHDLSMVRICKLYAKEELNENSCRNQNESESADFMFKVSEL